MKFNKELREKVRSVEIFSRKIQHNEKSAIFAKQIADFLVKSNVSKETVYSLSEDHELMFDILKEMGGGRTQIYSPSKRHDVGSTYHTVDTVMIICRPGNDDKVLENLYNNYQSMIFSMITFKKVVILSDNVKTFLKPFLVTIKHFGDRVLSINHY